ncbi:hypothetical protein THMIRHAM_07370 [Thiomicrorhabdus immobilis]|uniref:Uncharacterized protein n=1 Tax=Thiomicrorhabdus immobilis TaxID=2791037 RepID=A0ABM7MC98_9GAMM|nr:hypothetical protein [Thiomicrorhabdus immobilis]BCN92952.1 hypothetical protein THMIRHAM_07370 [Thiomicrorhabdus immobilis]
MAIQDDTFDPNDLESIDALLDEAELEAVSDNLDDDISTDEAESSAGGAVADIPDVDESIDFPDDSDGFLDSLDDLELDDEPKVVDVSTPKAQEEASTNIDKKMAENNPAESRFEAVPDADDFLAKRANAQVAQNSNMAAKDMDSIKKLIIIFGSILSVLALAGIGIGVWGALSASSAGMDEETLSLIESIKVASEQNSTSIHEVDKTAQSVEKKLDAINFQIEQLVADMATNTGSSKVVAKQEVIDPLGLGAHPVAHDAGNVAKDTHGVPVAHPVVPEPVVTHTNVVASPSMVAENPELMKKVTSVNDKLIKAQRRIDEVNSRVKKIQDQYQALIQSIKTVEKQVLVEQAEKAEQVAKENERQSKSRYQYSAPDGGFYDQSVTDSYP